jgi:hypothetical protein
MRISIPRVKNSRLWNCLAIMRSWQPFQVAEHEGPRVALEPRGTLNGFQGQGSGAWSRGINTSAPAPARPNQNEPREILPSRRQIPLEFFHWRQL